MKNAYPTPPPNLAALNQRLTNLTARGTVERVKRALAGVVVGQMMPEGAVRGGTAMKLRLGEDRSRFTPDFDVARRETFDEFTAALGTRLAAGWEGFAGRVATSRAVSKPPGVPGDYIMKAIDLKLEYQGRSWLTVPMEIGHDELGDTETPELRLADDLRDLVVNLGFTVPNPIAVLAIEHQIAQKLHACSEPGSERAHDLVDLQLLDREFDIDRQKTAEVCRRLFVFRKNHSWPPTVEAGAGWDSLYLAAAEGLDVLPDVNQAVRWTNQLIADLDART